MANKESEVRSQESEVWLNFLPSAFRGQYSRSSNQETVSRNQYFSSCKKNSPSCTEYSGSCKEVSSSCNQETASRNQYFSSCKKNFPSCKEYSAGCNHEIHSRNNQVRFLPTAFCFLLSAFCFLNCSGKKDTSPKFIQYYNQGEILYQKNCSNCHQKNGSGLGLVYPPLDSSDYMVKNFKDVICLIRNGKKGELIVNGKNFNQPMPGVPTLTDLEIAEIATYIYNTWSHQHGIIEVRDVTQQLKSCPN